MHEAEATLERRWAKAHTAEGIASTTAKAARTLIACACEGGDKSRTGTGARGRRGDLSINRQRDEGGEQRTAVLYRIRDEVAEAFGASHAVYFGLASGLAPDDAAVLIAGFRIDQIRWAQVPLPVPPLPHPPPTLTPTYKVVEAGSAFAAAVALLERLKWAVVVEETAVVESCLGEAHATLTAEYSGCGDHWRVATMELHAAVVDAAVGYLAKGQKVTVAARACVTLF